MTASLDSTWWVGVLLEGTGAGLSASGKLMWRYAALSKDPVRWYGIGGLLSMVIYPVLDTAAYAFTSQQILSASSGYIISFNVMGATLMLHETLTVQRAAAVIVIVLGSAASVAFGNHLQYNYTSADYWDLLLQPSAVMYYSCLFGWLSFSAWVLLSRRGRQILDETQRPVLMASLGGSVAGNMWVTKVAMELLGCTTRATGCPIGVLITTAGLLGVTVSIHLISLALLAYGLRSGSALQLVTAYEASALLTSALSSALVLSEYTGMSAGRLLLFYTTGVVPIFSGLLLLATWPTRWLGDGDRVCLDTRGSGFGMEYVEAYIDGVGGGEAADGASASGGGCAGGCVRRLRRVFGALAAFLPSEGGADGGGGLEGGYAGGGLAGGGPAGGGSPTRRPASEATKLLDGATPEQPTQRARQGYAAMSWSEGLGSPPPAPPAAALSNQDATGTTSGV